MVFSKWVKCSEPNIDEAPGRNIPDVVGLPDVKFYWYLNFDALTKKASPAWKFQSSVCVFNTAYLSMRSSARLVAVSMSSRVVAAEVISHSGAHLWCCC